MENQFEQGKRKSSGVTLAAVAQRVGLATGTVSAVLNNNASARYIPQRTRDRIRAAVQELNYRPNVFAQYLRGRRSKTVGVIVEEIGGTYGPSVVAGIEEYLREKGFLFLTAVHRRDAGLAEPSIRVLIERGVEGLIMIMMPFREPPALPTIAIGGRKNVDGVTNIVLNHNKAARCVLEHLLELGHRHLAFMKGPSTSTESDDQWAAIRRAAKELRIEVTPERTAEVENDDDTWCAGHSAARMLLRRGVDFTALFAYSDSSAIGAMRAFREHGVKVPRDVSVVGFGDSNVAAYSIPSLTTIRQPLARIGSIAARTLLERLEQQSDDLPQIEVDPELVIRESTQPPRLFKAVFEARVGSKAKPDSPDIRLLNDGHASWRVARAAPLVVRSEKQEGLKGIGRKLTQPFLELQK